MRRYSSCRLPLRLSDRNSGPSIASHICSSGIAASCAIGDPQAAKLSVLLDTGVARVHELNSARIQTRTSETRGNFPHLGKLCPKSGADADFLAEFLPGHVQQHVRVFNYLNVKLSNVAVARRGFDRRLDILHGLSGIHRAGDLSNFEPSPKITCRKAFCNMLYAKRKSSVVLGADRLRTHNRRSALAAETALDAP
jgi:hypothetical protein